MPSSLSPSPESGAAQAVRPLPSRAPSQAEFDEMRRRFVEASRRAEIVALVNSTEGGEEAAQAVVAELCETFDAELSFVLVERRGTPAALLAWLGLGPEQRDRLLHDPLAVGALRAAVAAAHEGERLAGSPARALMLAPFRSRAGDRAVVGVGRTYPAPFEPPDVALLATVTASTGHALERSWAGEERDQAAARQAALGRAAHLLNETLDRDVVFQRLCREVALALGAEKSSVALLDADGSAVLAAVGGIPADYVGFRRAPGDGLTGRAVRSGRTQVTNDYAGEGLAPQTTRVLDDIRSAVAVPLRWDGEVRGVLSTGFATERWITPGDVETVEAFAELAGVALRNAEEHARARQDADRDGLTGCLNHVAFQRRLRADIAGCERSGCELALALIDLDGFKQVNDRHGHVAGDGVLERVGAALRASVRERDAVARYGGDEFALLLADTPPERAGRVVERAVAALERASTAAGGVRVAASAGVATWRPGVVATELIERADASLMRAKRSLSAPRRDTVPPAVQEPAAERVDQAVLKRARHLRLISALSAKLARRLDPGRMLETAVAELHHELAVDRCVAVGFEPDGMLAARAGAGVEPLPYRPADFALPPDSGPIGPCLRERRTVLLDGGEGAIRSQLIVPLEAGPELVGAIWLQDGEPDAFDGDDATLVQSLAVQVGTLLHSAGLVAKLEEAYLGTAEALAAALAAKDGYTADHAGVVAALCVAVGRELRLDEASLRDLRFGALFHDIGKIAIPDAILHKPGPLSGEEWQVVRDHPVAGERILEPVPFLAGVRRIVRHDHERVDGTGYPDGLRGEEIPIGARIVLVCDAYQAMTSDRPYRKGMSHAEAAAELRAGAGTQFDAAVVEAFLRIVR